MIQKGGVKHLVTMATSEHMIMQNEALVALGLIAALDLGKTIDNQNRVDIIHVNSILIAFCLMQIYCVNKKSDSSQVVIMIILKCFHFCNFLTTNFRAARSNALLGSEKKMVLNYFMNRNLKLVLLYLVPFTLTSLYKIQTIILEIK